MVLKQDIYISKSVQEKEIVCRLVTRCSIQLVVVSHYIPPFYCFDFLPLRAWISFTHYQGLKHEKASKVFNRKETLLDPNNNNVKTKTNQ